MPGGVRGGDREEPSYSIFSAEVLGKRLGLLHKVQDTARVTGLQIQVLNASTSREIDVAFDILAHKRPDALFVAPDISFASRRVQLTNLAALC